MRCPKCALETHVKSGIKYGRQRYKCKNCGCNFTQSQKRGAPFEKKLQALKLYLEGMGFRAIGRILKVSNVTVLNWIRHFGRSLKEHVENEISDDFRHVDVVEIDEMWHFTGKKNKNYGYGSRSIDTRKKFLDFQLAVVVKKPTKR